MLIFMTENHLRGVSGISLPSSWCARSIDLCCVLSAFSLGWRPGSDEADMDEIVSISKRLKPCILGRKRLGYIQCC